MAERYRDYSVNGRPINNVTVRERLRQEISDQVANFLNSGGRIEVVGGPSLQQPPRCGAWRDLPDSVIGLN